MLPPVQIRHDAVQPPAAASDPSGFSRSCFNLFKGKYLMSYPIQHLKLGGVLDQAIALTKDHFGLLFSIMAMVFIPFSLVSSFIVLAVLPPPPQMGASAEQVMAFNRAALEYWPLTMGSLLFSVLIVLPLTNAAVVDAVAKLYLGKPASAIGSIKVGLSRLLPLFWTSILMFLAIMGGMILLIIPGILFAFWFSLSTHVVVLEKISGGAALARSRALMSGNIGTVFVLGLLMAAIGFGIGMVAGLVPQVHAQMILRIIMQAAMTILSTAALVVFYFSCRCGHENFDLEHLAQSMGENAADVSGEADEF